MDWQGALRARLIADASVMGLVWKDAAKSNKPAIYWVDRPQTDGLPAVTLQLITEDRPQNMGGFDGLDRSLVQVDVWGNSYSIVQQLKEAVIAALITENEANGIHFARAFIDSIRDLGERVELQFIHRASLDFVIYHRQA